MSDNYYDILGVSKDSSSEEIKKAYRKKAMQYHPDRAKWDKKQAEKKFKDLGEAYEILSDEKKRQQYDMFWSSKQNPFWWWNSYSSSWTSWFEDIFSSMSWTWGSFSWKTWWFDFNLEDLFWWWRNRQYEDKKEPIILDFEKTYEVPIFDFILWKNLEIRWVYWQKSMIKIPAWTKPWTKMRVKSLGKKQGGEVWNLIVKLEAKMPKNISDMDKNMLERISESIWY